MSTQMADNYNAYVAKHRERLEREAMGQVALMSDAEVVSLHDDFMDAYQIGCDRYGLGNFSLQEIGKAPARLGAMTPVDG